MYDRTLDSIPGVLLGPETNEGEAFDVAPDSSVIEVSGFVGRVEDGELHVSVKLVKFETRTDRELLIDQAAFNAIDMRWKHPCAFYPAVDLPAGEGVHTVGVSEEKMSF